MLALNKTQFISCVEEELQVRFVVNSYHRKDIRVINKNNIIFLFF
jgi:hypothetical protein